MSYRRHLYCIIWGRICRAKSGQKSGGLISTGPSRHNSFAFAQDRRSQHRGDAAGALSRGPSREKAIACHTLPSVAQVPAPPSMENPIDLNVAEATLHTSRPHGTVTTVSGCGLWPRPDADVRIDTLKLIHPPACPLVSSLTCQAVNAGLFDNHCSSHPTVRHSYQIYNEPFSATLSVSSIRQPHRGHKGAQSDCRNCEPGGVEYVVLMFMPSLCDALSVTVFGQALGKNQCRNGIIPQPASSGIGKKLKILQAKTLHGREFGQRHSPPWCRSSGAHGQLHRT